MIYCIGETLLDIIFRDNRPVTANPGGSMLNSSVSLGRAGAAVSFISNCGADQAGALIKDYLERNRVGTDLLHCETGRRTTVALAFLNERQEAEYTFYREPVLNDLHLEMPELKKGDIILFGSWFAIWERTRESINRILRQAKEAGAFILYDPNFRPGHLPELERLRPVIEKNIGFASLVRGSADDFRLIFGSRDPGEAYNFVRSSGCESMVLTNGGADVEYFGPGIRRSFPSPSIRPVSTVGAGDAFNAGMAWAVAGAATSAQRLSDPVEAIDAGMRFAADACLTLENCITEELGRVLTEERSGESANPGHNPVRLQSNLKLPK